LKDNSSSIKKFYSQKMQHFLVRLTKIPFCTFSYYIFEITFFLKLIFGTNGPSTHTKNM